MLGFAHESVADHFTTKVSDAAAGELEPLAVTVIAKVPTGVPLGLGVGVGMGVGVGVGPPALPPPPPQPPIVHSSNKLAAPKANVRRADRLLKATNMKRPTANSSNSNCGGLRSGHRELNGADATRDVVEMVTISVPDAVSEGGLKLQAAPVGKPEQLKVTVPAVAPSVSNRL
jgi:hypothetical protein